VSLKKLLVKAGLVVDETPQVLVDEANIDPVQPEPVAEPLVPELSGTIIALDEVYAQQGVPAVAFPAERLLKILDGLCAMDPANQQAAVAAMDAADDSWDLSQILDDAVRKIAALRSYSTSLDAAILNARDDEAAQKSAQNQQYEVLRKEINEQVAQLHAAAELATADHAKAIQELQSQANTTVAATQQEQVRLKAEIQRLESISRKLGGSVS
jgi:hypothetical protein